MPRGTDPVARAFAAYYRESAREGYLYQQPANTSGEVIHDGLRYVVLENSNEILAVYRIKPDGLLRRLKRWPKALEAVVIRTKDIHGAYAAARTKA